MALGGPTLIASATGSGSSTDLPVTAAVPAGAEVVVVGALNINATTATVVDNRGNTYAVALTASSGAPVVKGYSARAILTTALRVGDTITVALGGQTSSKQAHLAAAATGILALDKSTTAAGSSSSPSPGATGTLAAAAELLLVGIGSNQLAADTITLAGYTQLGSAATTSGTNDRRITLWSRVTSSTASSTPAAAMTSGGSAQSTTWSATMVSATIDTSAPPPSGPTYTVIAADGVTRLAATVRGVIAADGVTELPVSSTTVTS